ncbi:protein FAM13A isoform X2 [Carcharodon carcharias]|uniref:protein FAM13A isoform X2 n=1 Tax=Carcharodon carcharias TaxID=13397 RepID=UPI001B7F66B9|nr:protein FAM13A isoform X2 [Carcharodon carcharias]
MGAGAITVCQNKTAVRLKEDVKRIMAHPLGAQRACHVGKVFGVSLYDLQQQGQTIDGVPIVIQHMVEYLQEYGLEQEGLFRVNGSVRVVERLKQVYDAGAKPNLVREADVCSVASLLKLFLRELPDSLIVSRLHSQFMQLYQDHSGNQEELQWLLRQLPDVNYSLLKFLCHFLTQVAADHRTNRMTIYNLATVFGPNVFHVSPGFEGIKEQNISNKLMATLLENYDVFFENVDEMEAPPKVQTRVITVQEAQDDDVAFTVRPCPLPPSDLTAEATRSLPKRKKTKKTRPEGSTGAFFVPQPEYSSGTPESTWTLPIKSPNPGEMESSEELESSIKDLEINSSSQDDDRPMSPFYLSTHVPSVNSMSSAGDFIERTIRSAVEQHLFDAHGSGGQSSEESETGTSSSTAAVSARQRRRHLKEQDEYWRSKEMDDINKENIPSAFSTNEEGRTGHLDPSQASDKKLKESNSSYIEESMKPKRQKSSCKLSELNENQDSPMPMESSSSVSTSWPPDPPLGMSGPGGGLSFLTQPEDPAERERKESAIAFCGGEPYDHIKLTLNSTMKILESANQSDMAKAPRSPEAATPEGSASLEIPRLDLTGLSEGKEWGDPVPAHPVWQSPDAESEEASVSPQAGRLIRHLLEEDSDPMLSPRFYAYGQSQQFLNDTEVPPSPPNSHSFMRRRSSSLGSYDDEREELTPAQMTRRIQNLKKKIRRFEEKFEEERRYRPSHSDKATNPEVLKWMNELAKLRKQLKDTKLKVSEEGVVPQMRQRSNTLPKSFGSRLEKGPEKEQDKKQEVVEKAQKPAVDVTLDTILKKLQDKRAEVARPEDIKDMTREEIASEKVALQKGLLYYESIHGRPVTKAERQIMKPLYDRYRLVKQILSRATTIPVIDFLTRMCFALEAVFAPGVKSTGQFKPKVAQTRTAQGSTTHLGQMCNLRSLPRVTGEKWACSRKEPRSPVRRGAWKEEEDGSEDDCNARTDFAVTGKPVFTIRSFLDQLDDDADGFVSPTDDKAPTRCSLDLRLSTLHSASMPELLEQLQEARADKKRLRKTLRDFEDTFFQENGRNVQKEDRVPMAEEYSEYKHVKAKLRLLEVLISKQDPSKII